MSLGTLSTIAVLDVETITMGPDIRHFPQDNPIPGVSDFPLKNQTGFKNIWFPAGQQIHIFLDWVIGSIVRDGCHLTAKNLNRTLKANQKRHQARTHTSHDALPPNFNSSSPPVRG